MGEYVAKKVLELEPEDAMAYMQLLNIYVAADNRHLCENLEWQ
jgi:hypothetical protein